MSRFVRSGWVRALGVAVVAAAVFGGGLGRENFSRAPVAGGAVAQICAGGSVECGENHNQVLL